jgi:enoyl-CoA hydratase/2-(1,2-epoxy-1,2-dihydrophenyl)acetyl-CoA isomerase
MELEFQAVRYERADDIGTLTLARPAKRNAQNPLMWQELAALGEKLLAEDDLRCLVVRGEGKDFSAGIDLVEGMAGLLADLAAAPESRLADGLALAQTFRWIRQLGCASVAAVQGHAYGAGLQLALACDFRILADNAKVGLLETRYGLLPDMGATVWLPRLIGDGRAREMILLGEIIDADEARRVGLANRVVPADDLDTAAIDLAGRIAAQPPLAVRGARRAIEAAWHNDESEGFRAAVIHQIDCVTSEDFAEGGRALVEGRAPQWRGR